MFSCLLMGKKDEEEMTSSLWLVAGVVAFVLLILFLGLVTAVINRVHPERSRGRRRYGARNDSWRRQERGRDDRDDDDEREERRYHDEYRKKEERTHREYMAHKQRHGER